LRELRHGGMRVGLEGKLASPSLTARMLQEPSRRSFGDGDLAFLGLCGDRHALEVLLASREHPAGELTEAWVHGRSSTGPLAEASNWSPPTHCRNVSLPMSLFRNHSYSQVGIHA